MERLNQYQIDLLIQKLLDAKRSGGMIDWCNDHKCEMIFAAKKESR
jgi:hypothetical protein